MKKLAFTLAEVLITLTVIGVVAAMVLPNVIKNSEKKTLESQTKHFYSMMTLAVHNYMADNKVDDLTDTPLYCERFGGNEERHRCRQELDKFVVKYLKIAQVCEAATEGHATNKNRCYRQEAKVIDKSNSSHGEYTPRYILMNGYAIYIDPPGYLGGNINPMRLTVDVNGKAGPNRGGRDIWDLWVHYDGTINDRVLTPECVSNSVCMERFRSGSYSNCFTSYLGTGCFGRFKDNGFKFDY